MAQYVTNNTKSQPRSSMELRLKSNDVNFECAFAANDAESRCTTSLYTTTHIIQNLQRLPANSPQCTTMHLTNSSMIY